MIKLEFKLPNYQTYATDLEVTRGQQVRIAQISNPA